MRKPKQKKKKERCSGGNGDAAMPSSRSSSPLSTSTASSTSHIAAHVIIAPAPAPPHVHQPAQRELCSSPPSDNVTCKAGVRLEHRNVSSSPLKPLQSRERLAIDAEAPITWLPETPQYCRIASAASSAARPSSSRPPSLPKCTSVSGVAAQPARDGTLVRGQHYASSQPSSMPPPAPTPSSPTPLQPLSLRSILIDGLSLPASPPSQRPPCSSTAAVGLPSSADRALPITWHDKEEEEEVMQLAQSLHSTIAGRPFLPTLRLSHDAAAGGGSGVAVDQPVLSTRSSSFTGPSGSGGRDRGRRSVDRRASKDSRSSSGHAVPASSTKAYHAAGAAIACSDPRSQRASLTPALCFSTSSVTSPSDTYPAGSTSRPATSRRHHLAARPSSKLDLSPSLTYQAQLPPFSASYPREPSSAESRTTTASAVAPHSRRLTPGRIRVWGEGGNEAEVQSAAPAPAKGSGKSAESANATFINDPLHILAAADASPSASTTELRPLLGHSLVPQAATNYGVLEITSDSAPVVPPPDIPAAPPPSVAGGYPAAGRCESVIDRSSGDNGGADATKGGIGGPIAELRQRLLTEDFFSSPIRKFRRDGRFPWKLVTSLLLCALLLMQVMLYQVPVARSNEAMRRAMTEVFLRSDAYSSKEHGDVVPAPTELVDNLYAAVDHYVQTYYSLFNTSTSGLTYYASNTSVFDDGSAPWATGKGGTLARAWEAEHHRATGQRRRPDSVGDPTKTAMVAHRLMGRLVDDALDGGDRATATVTTSTKDVSLTTGATSPALPPVEASPLSFAAFSIAPVRMDLDVDTYSRREGVQDVRVTPSRLLWAAPLRWLSNGGTHPERDDGAAVMGEVGGRGAGRVDESREEARWLTFYVDSQHPLGPLAKYAEATRLLRRADRQAHRRGAVQPTRATRATTEPLNSTSTAAGRTAEGLGRGQRGEEPIGGNNALELVCRPRLDDLSGRYYRPCASAHTQILSGSGSAQASEFSLMDNVRRIRLEVTLRHQIDNEEVVGAWRTALGASSIYESHVVQEIVVHPGGQAKSQLRVRTRSWSIGAWNPFLPPLLMALLLSVLAVVELLLRLRALQRIARYQNWLRREQAAFQAIHASPEQQSLPGLSPDVDGSGAAATGDGGTGGASALDLPFLVTTTAPYEWGFPGSPAGQHPRQSDQHDLIQQQQQLSGNGNEPAPRSVRDGASERLYEQRYGAVGEREVKRLANAKHTLHNASSPSVSLDHLHTTLPESAGSPGVLPRSEDNADACPPLHQLYSPHLRKGGDNDTIHEPPMMLDDATPLLPRIRGGRAKQTNAAAAVYLSPSSPSTSSRPRPLPLSSLCPRTAPSEHLDRVAARSYLDVRATWRHHLQRSMGTGWHWMAIVAATTTLSYGVLLAAPQLPFLGVVQTDAYDAWASVLLGLSALLSCVLLVSYLRFFPSLYFPIFASAYVVPKLFVFVLCVSPLFLGFALFFVIAFGAHSSGRFSTLNWASLGLFFMTYGDSLLPTIDLVSSAPYAVTALLCSIVVIAFVLLFMMIMLNMAMTITQHEWLRLRRRFGAALSTSNLLFAIRSREQVKTEAVESICANLEMLWLLLAEEEEWVRQRTAHADPWLPKQTSSSSRGSGGGDEAAFGSCTSFNLAAPILTQSVQAGYGGENGEVAEAKKQPQLRSGRLAEGSRTVREAQSSGRNFREATVADAEAGEEHLTDSSHEVSAATAVPQD